MLGYMVPHVLSHFHPDLVSRMWWNWIWQLFPVWCWIVGAAWSTIGLFPSKFKATSDNNDDMPTIRRTIAFLAIPSTAAWWYTAAFAPFSMIQLFIPQSLGPSPTFAENMRLTLQRDEAKGLGASLLWLLYTWADLQRAGMTTSRNVLTMVASLAVGVLVVGPGSAFLLGWLAREELLASKHHKDAVVMETLMREQEVFEHAKDRSTSK
ncbi:hypothetical protein EJ08DRAFT_736731 [Tothia fuscella]|uniref:Uncharacterized protein n=1 Tax=Tothia fuscella TaxID=1048955 RepID=A0A9P4TVZ6_9PEZI|nr:hypothetical protein EJ08DRAFT_736731 [Tothia fuscella]